MSALRRSARLLALAAVVTTGGCNEEDFGDRALRFVETEVTGLSRAHVEAVLANSVSGAFQRSLTDVVVEAKVAAAVAGGIEAKIIDSAKISNAELFTEFSALDTHTATIFRLKSQLERNLILLDRVGTACEDRSVFSVLGLGNLGHQGPIMLATAGLKEQEADWSIEAKYDGAPFYVQVGRFLVSLFGANHIWKQNEKVREALRLIPERVVQEPEVHRIYVSMCRTHFAELQASFQEARGLTEETLRGVATTLEALQSAKAIVEAILRTREIAAFVAEVGDQLSQAQNLILQGELWTDVVLRLEQLRDWSARIREERTCLAALSSVETYADALIELRAQLDVLQRETRDLPDLSGKLADAARAAAELERHVPDHYAWARSAPCR